MTKGPQGDGSHPDDEPFDRFKNERDSISRSGPLKATVAAMDWAVGEIERLRATSQTPDAVREALQALKPFAKAAELAENDEPAKTTLFSSSARHAITLGDLKRAAKIYAALSTPSASARPQAEAVGKLSWQDREAIQAAISKHCHVNMKWPATAQIDNSHIDELLAELRVYAHPRPSSN